MLLEMCPLHSAFCWGGAAHSLALALLPAQGPTLCLCRAPLSPLTQCLLSLPVFLSVNNLPQTLSTYTFTTCHILHPTSEITMVTPR